ncbi:MAG: ketopantoate reductase family protein [Proteobacteria bacterium]|nr:ketopantoate reductase family protein [Pseudomonadota bacterium]
MKTLVLGAGGVGGYFGGRMVEAGADVTFLVRPKRAAALAKDGLRIASPYGNATLKVKFVMQDAVKPEYDLVMFTTKAYDLVSGMDAIAPAMGGTAVVLPFLNGMAHLQVLDERFGRDKVLGGVAYIAAMLAPDGEVRQLAEFQRIVFGPRAASQKRACQALSADLAGVKFDWKQLDDIDQAMWEKWVMLATIAGITSLMRAPVGDIVFTGSGEKLTLALLAECAAIARAAGFPPGEAAMATYRGMATAKGSFFGASMMRDIESGGAIEGDHVLGALLALARKHGLATPMLEVSTTHVEAYSARRAREAR